MSPRERVEAVLKGELPDTVPVVPVVDGYHAPRVLGVPNWECFLNPDKMGDAILSALQHYGYDGAVVEMGIGYSGMVLGCKVEVEGKDVPLFVGNLINTPEDLEKLQVPDPWEEDKMLPVEKVVEEAGDRYYILGAVRAPFEIACIVRGYVSLLGDIYDTPDFVHEIIERSEKITLELGRAMIEAGVDAILLRDSLASSSVISPGHYHEFAHPYEVRVIREFRKKVRVVLHICRNAAPILESMANTGADVLEIDSPVNLGEAKQQVGDRVVLKGNIDSVEVIERGSAEVVEEAVKECMQAAKEGGRYILSTGDSVPRAAPPENLHTLVKAGRKFGGYA